MCDLPSMQMMHPLLPQIALRMHWSGCLVSVSLCLVGIWPIHAGYICEERVLEMLSHSAWQCGHGLVNAARHFV